MTRRKRGRPSLTEQPRRCRIYALCTQEEYAVVEAQAQKEQVSLSDYLRRCINSTLLEGGDEVPLLAERVKA